MPSTDPGATSKDAMFFEEPVYGDTPYQFRVKKDKIALIPHRTAYGPRAIPKLVTTSD